MGVKLARVFKSMSPPVNTLIERLMRRKKQILDELEKTRAVEIVCFLQQRFVENDVTKDRIFQFVFKGFYHLERPAVSNPFCEQYFRILESSKVGTPNAVDVLKKLRCADLEHPKLQITFASKLCATVNPKESPICDGLVMDFYELSPSKTTEKLSVRCAKFRKNLDAICTYSEELLANNEIQKFMENIRCRWPDTWERVPDLRLLDLVVWAHERSKRPASKKGV
jgi:hypothetical protein